MIKRRREIGLDKLKTIGDGVYCIYPFSELDDKNKGAFKIGIATGGSFYHRLEDNYHTYYPMGFYYKSFLEDPTLEKKKLISKLSYYKEIEKIIFDNIVGEKIISDARSVKEGRTEWIYTNQKSIDDVFEKAHSIYGGKLKSYNLTKRAFKAETKGKDIIFEGKIKFV